ncbi:TonB family protein [Emticicia fontis]
MKRILIAALMLSALTALSQEVRKVVKTDSSHASLKIREEYYVLRDAKKVKHGLYKKWINEILFMEGYYKYNKKDSIWIRYGSHRNPLVVMHLSPNKGKGIVEFYLPTGELEQKYDYTTNELVYFKPENNGTYHQIITGKDTTYSTLSRPPINIGGRFSYFMTVANNLRYPVSALKNNNVGRIHVSFIIDEKGKRSRFKVIKRGNKIFDEEAIRLVKLIDDWLPAMQDGKPVKVIHIVPITFDTDEIIEP